MDGKRDRSDIDKMGRLRLASLFHLGLAIATDSQTADGAVGGFQAKAFCDTLLPIGRPIRTSAMDAPTQRFY